MAVGSQWKNHYIIEDHVPARSDRQQHLHSVYEQQRMSIETDLVTVLVKVVLQIDLGLIMAPNRVRVSAIFSWMAYHQGQVLSVDFILKGRCCGAPADSI